MIKISAPNCLRIAAMERLIVVGAILSVIDDVSPHHRQTQSLWETFTGSEQRSETYAKLSQAIQSLALRGRSGGVEHSFA